MQALTQLSPFLSLLSFTPSKPNSSTSLRCTGDNTVGYRNELQESFEMRKLQFKTPDLEMNVKELEELPENWRRSKLAWLCKELPSHKSPTIFRLLTAHKKWMRQVDATYIAVHCLRIRHNEAAFSVYKWMTQRPWFRFDFALATKLADYIGRERKVAKCREIFDDIINQGRVPSESTFHILIVAYLSVPDGDYLQQACEIYSQMIHLGAYRPRLSLQNSLFRAIIDKPANSAKQYLKQAEFIFHNVVTCGLEVHKDIYGGLLWLHSYQDSIDKERMLYLRKEMHQQGFKESADILLSILRACSKEGDLVEAEMTWGKLLKCDGDLPYQAYVYKMQVHAKVGDFERSLNIFREMQKKLEQVNVVAYHTIIEIMCSAQEVELAEALMEELIKSGLQPLISSFLDLLNMYFKLRLHDKVESTFFECRQRCRPNRTVYSIYLESLVQTGNIVKAESIFSQMVENEEAIGVSARSCNVLLDGYLFCGDHEKAKKLYGFMRENNYEAEPFLLEKLESVPTYNKKVVQKSVILKLTPAQREILVGLLLGGLQIEYAEDKKKPFLRFEFKDNSAMHSVLKRHIYNKYHEWLQPSDSSRDDGENIPSKFLTVPHAFFSFYADQFWSNGRRSIPTLIHRWLTPRVLAYWFMYNGYRTATGDILLKLQGNKDDVERVLKALKSKSLEFRVKQKGKVFWVGFLESNSISFWRLIEPYILDDLRDILDADNQRLDIQLSSESYSDYGEEPDSSGIYSNDGL
ncbi:pentatricopeptide repeat-containing protein At2g15820, chloroplastic [Silene latifolia]|uniref:pentatricopeptide repeat-containing protein At2g15820, chloroplastic n=1 Tax=Silene latifolia TaxID=37657 RepID=UPI003D78A528